MCAPTSVWVWRPEDNPWELLAPSSPGPQELSLGHQAWRQCYSSSWAIVLAPIFILLFSNLIYCVDMVAQTIISAFWEAEAGGWSWVKEFEAGLGNIARLSWNKEKQTSSIWNPTVHCPNAVLSTISWACCFGLPRQMPHSMLQHLLWGFFVKKCLMMNNVLSRKKNPKSLVCWFMLIIQEDHVFMAACVT